MFQQGAVVEIPVTGSTVVNDVVKLFNHEQIYKMKRLTIQLEPSEENLSVFALMLLYSALTIYENEGKIKPRQNKKNVFISNNGSSIKEMEDIIEKKYDLSLIVAEPEKKVKTSLKDLKEKYKDLPITWGKGKLKLEDVFGIWKDNPVTLEEIRKKAWKRR
jgi:hypothetical protein